MLAKAAVSHKKACQISALLLHKGTQMVELGLNQQCRLQYGHLRIYDLVCILGGAGFVSCTVFSSVSKDF